MSRFRTGRATRAARVTAPRPEAGRETRDDLERVFHAEYGRVLAVARRVLGTGRAAQAEDVAQDVFIAFSRCDADPGQARGWLLTAAAHTALNVLRSEHRRTRRERAAAPAEELPDVADDVITRDRRARVRRALAKLPEKQSMVLVLRHSGLSYQEIGAALGMPASSVGTTLRRAEEAARKELENDDEPRR